MSQQWKLRQPELNPYKKFFITEVNKKHLPYCYTPETNNKIRNRCVSIECQKHIKDKCGFKNEMIISGGGY